MIIEPLGRCPYPAFRSFFKRHADFNLLNGIIASYRALGKESDFWKLLIKSVSITIMATLSTLRIRKARRTDSKAIAKLHKDEGWRYDDEATVKEHFDRELRIREILVAEDDSGVVGKIEAFEGKRSGIGRFIFIKRFVISSRHRGKGVGKAMLEYVINQAKKKGIGIIELGVTPNNRIANALYKKYGFKDVKREVIILMRKSIKSRS